MNRKVSESALAFRPEELLKQDITTVPTVDCARLKRIGKGKASLSVLHSLPVSK